MSKYWPGMVRKKSIKRENTLGLLKLKTRKMLDEKDEDFIDEILSRRSDDKKSGQDLFEGGSREASEFDS